MLLITFKHIFMKKLTLIRHAKSTWEYPIDDINRPITNNGIEKAIKVALNSAKEMPGNALVWSSTAIRASQTAKLFLEHWKLSVKMQLDFKKELYTFDSNVLERIIKSCPNDYENLILFGHNSAITDFVNKFGDIFIDNVPTAGFVSIIFDIDQWNELKKGKTDKIIFPKDI